MYILSLLLWPISETMKVLLVAFYALLGSYGMSIILLSLTVRLATAPIARYAVVAERKDQEVLATMESELREFKRTSRGRQRFERTEELYRRHNYHPIKSVASLLPLSLQIPFLLAALFLLTGYPPLAGESWLFIQDLLRPDGLIPFGDARINLLPIVITIAALADSALKTDSTRTARMRFLIVAVVIAVLIYPMPAGVCLFWLTNNIASLARSAWQRWRVTNHAVNT